MIHRHTPDTTPRTGPDAHGSSVLPFAIIFVFGLGVHGWNVRNGPLGIIAEGVAYVGAQRALDGDLPYRDFWTMYAPGSFYLLAGLFALLGTEMIVARIAAVVLVALAGMAALGIARRVSRPAVAWPITLILVTALHPMGHRFGTYPPALASLMGALLAATIYFQTGRLKWLMFAGVSCSLAIVFKHDVGGYVSIAILGTLLVRRLSVADARSGGPPLRREVLAFIGGCATVAVPVYSTLLLCAGHDMWQDIVLFPLTDFPASRGERYPGPIPNWTRLVSVGRAAEEVSERVRFTAPAVLFVVSIVVLVRQRKRLPAARFASHAMIAMCMPFFWLAAHVQINTHIYTMAALGGLTLAILIENALPARPATRRRALTLAFVVVIFGFGWLARPGFEIARPLIVPYSTAAIDVPHTRGILAGDGQAKTVQAMVRVVRARTTPDDSVFVGCHRHDVVIVNPTLTYLLIDRPIPTRYHELHPAIADTDEVQREIIAELEKSSVRLAVLWRRFEDDGLDRVQRSRQAALPRTGATRLDDYLRRNFEKIESVGRYEIWQRRAPGGG